MIIQAIKRIMQKHDTPPELHKCPHCGAPLTRLTLVHGGIINLGHDSKVKATIKCRECNRLHSFRGDGVKAHWLIMTLQNQSRKYRGAR